MGSLTLTANLTLIGYRGTGKTTVAKRLALSLGCDWMDADAEVERTAGKSIAAIFADDGEAAFRELETQVLRRLYSQSTRILALGGGAVLRAENRRLVRGGGTTVWLTASPAVIHTRLQADAASPLQRPDLTAKGGLQEIVDVLQQRHELYQQCADFVVDTEGKSVDEVADGIIQHLQDRSGDS